MKDNPETRATLDTRHITTTSKTTPRNGRSLVMDMINTCCSK